MEVWLHAKIRKVVEECFPAIVQAGPYMNVHGGPDMNSMNSMFANVLAVFVFAAVSTSCVYVIPEHSHEHTHSELERSPERAHAGQSIATAFAGSVTDAAGNPIRAKVSLVGQDGGSYSTSTSDDGGFAFRGLREDVYNVTVADNDGLIAVYPAQQMDVSTAELKLVDRGCLLDVGIFGREAARLAVFSDGVRVYDFTLRDGTPEVIATPTGEVIVHLYANDVDESRTLNSVSDQVGIVRFDLTSNG
ncbi:MAG: hypothetical protein ACI8TQ_002354 [Planctomycetota bacterium]|jgi:hypothetical protein